MDKKEEALRIVEEGLKELESQKGSITVAVQKLSRASNLLEEKNYYIWAEIELGNEKFIQPLKELLSKTECTIYRESDGRWDTPWYYTSYEIETNVFCAIL